MFKKVKKWGNSLAIRIPTREAKALDIYENKEVEIERKGEKLIIKPRKDELKKLLAKINDKNKHPVEFSQDKSKGEEAW